MQAPQQAPLVSRKGRRWVGIGTIRRKYAKSNKSIRRRARAEVNRAKHVNNGRN